jgi:hypothetical protein
VDGFGEAYKIRYGNTSKKMDEYYFCKKIFLLFDV